MKKECTDASCSVHGIDHTLCSKELCGCCCHENHHHHDRWCHFPEQLLELADDAWMELLKEKIKEHIEKTNGKRLNELARLVNDANHTRWKNIFSEKRNEDHYKALLRDYFHETDKK